MWLGFEGRSRLAGRVCIGAAQLRLPLSARGQKRRSWAAGVLGTKCMRYIQQQVISAGRTGGFLQSLWARRRRGRSRAQAPCVSREV